MPAWRSKSINAIKIAENLSTKNRWKSVAKPSTGRVTKPSAGSSWKPKPSLKAITRIKVLIIPKINNKFIVVKDKKSNELTFIGGGCKYKPRFTKNNINLKQCALKELREESKNSIKLNLNNLQNVLFNFTTKKRSKEEYASNIQKGQNITSHYYGFVKNISNTHSINKIKNNFNKYNLKNNKSYNETSNIMLMSRNNLEKINKSKKYYVINKSLNKLR